MYSIYLVTYTMNVRDCVTCSMIHVLRVQKTGRAQFAYARWDSNVSQFNNGG